MAITHETQSQPRGDRAWPIAMGGIGVVVFAAGLALAWTYANALFLIFAGVLLGIFLNALANMLERVLPVAHWFRLTIVCLLLASGIAGLATLGGNTLAEQAKGLSNTIKSQITNVRDLLEKNGVDTSLLGIGNIVTDSTGDAEQTTTTPARPHGGSGLPSAGAIASGGGAVLTQTLKLIIGAVGAVGNFFIVLYLGLAFAAQPTLYRDGLLWMFPKAYRPKATEVVADISAKLQRWLVAQMIVMAVVFLLTWLGLWIIGVESAFILGVQAGLLTFIPTIGAILGGLIVVLASFASGWPAALAAAILFMIIHALESYILTPLMQKEAIDIPPATLFATQILLGTVFGLWGLALALPVMAVIKVIIDKFHAADEVEATDVSAGAA